MSFISIHITCIGSNSFLQSCKKKKIMSNRCPPRNRPWTAGSIVQRANRKATRSDRASPKSSVYIERTILVPVIFVFAYGFGAHLIGPIQLHVKRQNSSICKFPRTLLGLFSVCEWQDLSFTYQKSEKTTYLDNLVFSAFSVLLGTVKKFGLKSDLCQTLPGECAGESVTK